MFVFKSSCEYGQKQISDKLVNLAFKLYVLEVFLSGLKASDY